MFLDLEFTLLFKVKYFYANLLFTSLQELNLAVCGSEIVGLVPLRALLEAAEYYIQKENLFILEEDQKIKLVREVLMGVLE